MTVAETHLGTPYSNGTGRIMAYRTSRIMDLLQ